MKSGLLAPLALAVLHVTYAADEEPAERSHTVDISASVPVVAVAPQPTDRHFLSLPSLEYRFRIEPQCQAGWQPEWFSLNVADSRVSLAASELNDGEIVLRVPARQIAPVPVAGFCEIVDADKGSAGAGEREAHPAMQRQLEVGGALSAHASLICGGNGTRDIVYTARPLDVLLSCAAPAAGLPESP